MSIEPNGPEFKLNLGPEPTFSNPQFSKISPSTFPNLSKPTGANNLQSPMSLATTSSNPSTASANTANTGIGPTWSQLSPQDQEKFMRNFAMTIAANICTTMQQGAQEEIKQMQKWAQQQNS